MKASSRAISKMSEFKLFNVSLKIGKRTQNAVLTTKTDDESGLQTKNSILTHVATKSSIKTYIFEGFLVIFLLEYHQYDTQDEI